LLRIPAAGTRRAAWRAPAVQALAIQLLAALLLYAAMRLSDGAGGPTISLGQAALVQGIGAALLSWWRGLAWWWLAIQLLFPLALLMTLALHLPPVVFLLLFGFLLALYWSTFRTQVPFYPSGPAVWASVLALLPEQANARLIDIGSGVGGLVLSLARQRRDGHFTGIELAPLPWLVSRLRGRSQRSTAHFVRGDYEGLNLADFDVVFAYLSPAAMPALWQKAQREMRPGTLLLSYEFPIPGQPADVTVLPLPHGPFLYGWRR
jgi:SAM-dependent methyltransferase